MTRLYALRRHAGLLAGPAALAGFFLPWVQGSGILLGESFSGFDLLRLSGSLRGLGLDCYPGPSLTLLRLLLLALPIAAAWLLLLAPWRNVKPAAAVHKVVAAYVVLAALTVAAYGVMEGGTLLPLPGASLLLFAAASLAVGAWPASRPMAAPRRSAAAAPANAEGLSLP